MPIIKGARPCRGVVVWGRKGGGSTAHGRRRIGRGGGGACVAAAGVAPVYFGGSGQGVRGMERLVST